MLAARRCRARCARPPLRARAGLRSRPRHQECSTSPASTGWAPSRSRTAPREALGSVRPWHARGRSAKAGVDARQPRAQSATPPVPSPHRIARLPTWARTIRRAHSAVGRDTSVPPPASSPGRTRTVHRSHRDHTATSGPRRCSSRTARRPPGSRRRFGRRRRASAAASRPSARELAARYLLSRRRAKAPVASCAGRPRRGSSRAPLRPAGPALSPLGLGLQSHGGGPGGRNARRRS